MENGSRLILIEWGENHKPIVDRAAFSLHAPNIHKAHSELKLRGAKVDVEVTQIAESCFGFHVIDSEGNAIWMID